MIDSLERPELFKNREIKKNPTQKAGNSQGKKSFHDIPRNLGLYTNTGLQDGILWIGGIIL